jgi:hypothetical protein
MLNATAVKMLFVGIGLSALLVGLGWLGYSGWLVARSRSAEGVVVGHAPDSTRGSDDLPHSGLLYAPVVSFTTAAGRSVEFTSLEYVAHSRYPLGAAVPVLYDPSHPERAEIDTAETLWLAGTAWIVCGLACIAGGFGAARAMEKMREPTT